MTGFLGLALLGAAVGAVGTLIGAGGGFLLVPILIFLHPEAAAETITSISLAVVFCNSLSGSVAYARMGRIDYKWGWRFALAAAPAAALGAFSTAFFPRRTFDLAFAIVLLLAGAAMLIWPEPEPRAADQRHHAGVGMSLTAAAAYVSSLFGIGGGGLQVPVMVYAMGFTPHVATATSQFVLAGMALVGTVTHLASGALAGVMQQTVYLCIGALVGAQLGAAFSNRIHGTAIIRVLAGALAVVGVRILWKTIGG